MGAPATGYDVAMIRNVVLHLLGELPMVADIESLPSVGDATLLCTNLRTIDGKKPISTDHLDSVFVIPLQTVRFIEIPRVAIAAAGIGLDHRLSLPAIGAGDAADAGHAAGRGQLTRLSRDDLEQRFAAYFESVRYSVWDDLQPPHVSISDDGRYAWMAAHIEAQLTVAGKVSADGTRSSGVQRRFESAWIAAYEKRGGHWQMVGIASSVVDRTQ